MSNNQIAISIKSQMELELYFLIAKFLDAGPCKKASEVLARELQENQLLPKRVDWEGSEHYRSYENLMYRHIAPDHLFKICERICPILDKEIPPNVHGVRSLLGAGRQSLLRTKEDLEKAKWPVTTYTAVRYGVPFTPPVNMPCGPNIAIAQLARNITGVSRRDQTCHVKVYTKFSQLSRSLGHLSAVYCAAFDRTGSYIITGSDDHLVKIWSAVSGRLYATLRGHSAEIADITVSYDNKLLATGSCDKTVRVWSLKNNAPVAVLHGHNGMITSIQFCPMPRGDVRYLASTGTDGCVCFWSWNNQTKVFNTKPIKFIERSRAGAQMLCSSFSPGGVFLATGSSDNVIRVYSFGAATFEKICELEAHCDRVDSIGYSNHSTRFLSGSKDGTARIWRYERQEWKNVVLNMSFTSPIQVIIPEDSRNKPKVTMVTWSCDDEYVITAVTDLLLKVWNSHTGKLLNCLKGHQDEVFVLEQNPVDPRILLSAGHDGYIMLWDIFTGTLIKHLYNNIQGQGHGAVFDCKWAPDGQSFAATDSHGFLRYFGFGSNEKYRRSPEEQFFHTDYRPLIRDANDYVLDEQTQQAPHLMPPAFLVNIDGNPHPPKFQRLVPGRERCSDHSLVPQMGITPSGDREVLDDTIPVTGEEQNQERNDHIIDHMITRMQHEQDQRIIAAGGAPLMSPTRSEPITSPLGSPQPGPSGLEADAAEGGPSSSGLSQQSTSPSVSQLQEGTRKNISVWSCRICIKPLDKYKLKSEEKIRQALMDDEVKQFVLERKKKPFPASGNDSSDSGNHMKTRKKHKPRSYRTRAAENEETTLNRLTTRALYDTEVEDNEEEVSSRPPPIEEDEGAINIPSDEGWKSDDKGDSDSSTEYSDWAADGGVNLQPPKRRSERRPKRRKFSSSENEDEDTDEEDTQEDLEVDDNDDSDFEAPEGPRPKRSKRSPPSPRKRQPVRKRVPKRPNRVSRRERQKEEHVLQYAGISELKEEFRPPEWLSDSIPRKTPYFPQMGDELYYLRQGHGEYIKAVQRRNLYEIDDQKGQPWNKLPTLREHELVKVVAIKYEFKKGGNGTRLVCLKLNMIDPDTGRFSGTSFSVKYHDVPDVLDFLVLRQVFESTRRKRWKPGDRIRSMIEDSWWFGTIESQVPFQEDFPDSMFLCYIVRWDNNESERMSPWDFEHINKKSLPAKVGEGVPITKEEYLKHLYSPKESDWPSVGLEQECDRIVRGIEQIMELSIAEPFLAPVDLQAFPLYAMTIEYPVDLSLVKARLENRFYRRVTAVQFDVRFIESNAKAFNMRGSEIVRKAKLVTELCLRLIRTVDCTDIMPMYNELVKDTEFALSDAESVESGPTTTSRSRRGRRLSSRRNSIPNDPYAWVFHCKELITTMIHHDDSEPFRAPVDPVEYPVYYETIENPMDLAQVKENLDSEHYRTPVEFNTDIRLVFSNSRTFNTNKRSRIYAMTLRLSAMYEAQFKPILEQWKIAAAKHKGKGKSSKKLPSKVIKLRDSSRRNLRESNSPQPSSSFTTRASSSRNLTSMSGILETRAARSSAASTSIAIQSGTLPRRAAASRKRFQSESFEEEAVGESDKENQSDSEETDELSDFETEDRTRRPARQRNTARRVVSSSQLVNGKTRYVTRTQTGTAKRKQYNHSDSEDLDTSVTPHRKRARRKPKTSSEDDDDDDHYELETPPQRKRNLRNTRQTCSDEEDNDDDEKPKEEGESSKSDTDVNVSENDSDVEDEQDSNEEGGSESEEEQQHEEQSPLTRTRRGGSRPFPSRRPPPLLSSKSASTVTSSKNIVGGSTKRRRLRSSSCSISPPQDRSGRSSQRSARGGVSYSKYFEDDDEEDVKASVSSSSRRSTRTRIPVTYEEDTDDEGDGAEGPVSISSRGRVRKINSRLRAFMGE